MASLFLFILYYYYYLLFIIFQEEKLLIPFPFLLPPVYEVRGKVMFWHVSVSLCVCQQGVAPARSQSQMGGAPILSKEGNLSFPTGGTPILLPPSQDLNTSPPPQAWIALGQVMPWAVRLLRFPAGGLSCSCELFDWATSVNLIGHLKLNETLQCSYVSVILDIGRQVMCVFRDNPAHSEPVACLPFSLLVNHTQ